MRRLTYLALVLLCALMACAQSTYPYPPDPSNPQSETNPLYVTTPPTVDFHMNGANYYLVRTCTANCAVYLPSCVGKVGQVFTIVNGAPFIPGVSTTDLNANGARITINPYPGESVDPYVTLYASGNSLAIEPGTTLKLKAMNVQPSGCEFALAN